MILEAYIMQNNSKLFSTRTLAFLGVLGALSIALVTFIHFPIFPPPVTFLEYDPADIPLLMAGFMFGPIPGVLLTIVVAGIQAMTVSAQSGVYGFIMHAISSGSLVAVASIIYARKGTTPRAIIALAAGALTSTLVMIPANLFITPIFMGQPREAVMDIMLPFIIPFNLIKSFGNAALTFILYKALARFVK